MTTKLATLAAALGSAITNIPPPVISGGTSEFPGTPGVKKRRKQRKAQKKARRRNRK